MDLQNFLFTHFYWYNNKFWFEKYWKDLGMKIKVLMRDELPNSG